MVTHQRIQEVWKCLRMRKVQYLPCPVVARSCIQFQRSSRGTRSPGCPWRHLGEPTLVWEQAGHVWIVASRLRMRARRVRKRWTCWREHPSRGLLGTAVVTFDRHMTTSPRGRRRQRACARSCSWLWGVLEQSGGSRHLKSSPCRCQWQRRGLGEGQDTRRRTGLAPRSCVWATWRMRAGQSKP